MSPRFVIKTQKAHCMEGSMLAAAALEFNGFRPFVMDLRSVKPGDDDHVVAVFRRFGHFGAISKTNHGVLRYREPIYKTPRELALSYFHEYFLKDGKKTLREYSEVFDLGYFDKASLVFNHPASVASAPLLEKEGSGPSSSPFKGEARRGENWRTSEKDLFEIPAKLDKIKHYKILTPAQIKNLRLADKIEIKAGEIVEWKK